MFNWFVGIFTYKIQMFNTDSQIITFVDQHIHDANYYHVQDIKIHNFQI